MKNFSGLPYSKHHILAAALGLAAALISTVGDAAPWPRLETDRQKLEYGLALRAQTKPFFTGTFNYGMEWWNIATDQEQIKRAIEGHYPAELDSRPLMTITIKEPTARNIPGASQIASAKASLLSLLASHPGANKKQFIDELTREALLLRQVKAGELISQLISASGRPEDERKVINRASIEEKVEYLEKVLPPELIAADLPKNLRKSIPAVALGPKQKTLELIRRLLKSEVESTELLQLAVLTRHLSLETSVPQMQHAINSLGTQDFAAASDTEAVQAYLTSLLGLEHVAIASAGTTPDELAKWGASAFNRAFQKLSTTETQQVTVEAPKYQIIEQPRDLAIMRSAWGNDCVHTCSFAMADNPASRTFYFVDLKQNQLMGYIEGEIKASEHGDVLVLATVNGRSITPEQTDEILLALLSHRNELGVSDIGLVDHNLGLFMNYADVVTHLEKLIDGKPRVAVHAKYPEVVNEIEKHVKADYQKEDQNPYAVVVHPHDLANKFVRATSIEFRQDTDVMQHKGTASEVFLFALEMDATERWIPKEGQLSDGERAIVTAGLNLEDYKRVRQSLQNANHLPYETALAAARAEMEKHGFTVDKSFVNEYPHLFYDMQLAAGDASQGALKKSNLRLAAQIIKRGMWHATWGLKEYAKNPENLDAINTSKELEGVMRWAATDVGFHSIQLQNMVSAGIGFPLLREPQMTRELLRIVAHGHAWGPDLSRKILRAVYPNPSHDLFESYANDPDSAVRDGVQKLKDEHKPAADSVIEKLQHDQSRRMIMCKHIF